MKRCVFTYLIITVVSILSVAPINFYILNSNAKKQLQAKQEAELGVITIDIKINPALKLKNFTPQTFNSLEEVYKVYDIKSRRLDMASENSNLSTIAKHITKHQTDDLNENILQTLQHINTQWDAITSNASNYNVLIQEYIDEDPATFSIAKELLDFAEQQNFPVYPTGRKNPNKGKEFEFPHKALPQLSAAIKKIAHIYNMTVPEVVLSVSHDTSCYSPMHTLWIGLFDFVHLTNDEVETFLAHEFAHLSLNHSHRDLKLRKEWKDDQFPECNTTLTTLLNSMSRANEREADSKGLRMVPKPLHYMTALMKIMLFGLSEISKESRIKATSYPKTHPTMHERICYALAQS